MPMTADLSEFLNRMFRTTPIMTTADVQNALAPRGIKIADADLETELTRTGFVVTAGTGWSLPALTSASLKAAARSQLLAVVNAAAAIDPTLAKLDPSLSTLDDALADAVAYLADPNK